DEPEITVLVHRRAVAGRIPVAAMTPRRRFGVAPVLAEHPDGALGPHTHPDLPFGPPRQLLTVFVDDRERVTRRRQSHRAWLPLDRRIGRGEQHGLGLAVRLVDVL